MNRLPIMKFEPVAQSEAVKELVRRDAILTDHLRVRLEFGVERKERIEHHIAVIARDVRRRPYRVENAQIRLRDKAQRVGVGGRGPRGETKAGKARRPCRDPKFAACQSMSD